MQRRQFFQGALAAGAFTAAASATVGRHALAALPEPVLQHSAATAAPWVPPGVTGAGLPYRPVVTLNGWTLPFRMRDGVKEFHLVAEPVVREVAPGFVVNMWGYNGQSPGPTIEVVEGDRVRIFVSNRLPEPTSIHWHGQRLPSGMDGVAGINQPSIGAGKTFVYEFQARRPGTFMYHPHADEMVQLAMGMMGFWVTHPKLDARGRHPQIDAVQRDYCFLLNAFDVEPGAKTPTVATMLDFNIWALNSRVFPGIDPLVARLGDRVRIRMGNLTMVNHPIHVHGVEFEVTGTDGGPVPRSARWPEVTVDLAVGQMRQIEFIADEPGDWAVHCHKSHHTMGPMGHDVPTTDRSRSPRAGGQNPGPGTRLHGHGRARHVRHEADADGTAPQHPAHDGRPRPVRPDRHGRDADRAQGARQPAAQRLPRPRPLRLPERQRGL